MAEGAVWSEVVSDCPFLDIQGRYREDGRFRPLRRCQAQDSRGQHEPIPWLTEQGKTPRSNAVQPVLKAKTGGRRREFRDLGFIYAAGRGGAAGSLYCDRDEGARTRPKRLRLAHPSARRIGDALSTASRRGGPDHPGRLTCCLDHRSFRFVLTPLLTIESRAAGIKTAGDMIWDFKQRLYRSQKKLPPSAITDVGEPAVQRKLQAYFDALGGFPPAGSETEYSAFFEATYHSPKDRRAYLDELIARGKPSFGHHALALLMAEDLCRVIWATNFDRTVEDAAASAWAEPAASSSPT